MLDKPKVTLITLAIVNTPHATTDKSLGLKLFQFRARRKWSLNRVSREMGKKRLPLSDVTLWKIERGEGVSKTSLYLVTEYLKLVR